MDLKKKIKLDSYQLRLFLPLVGTLWLIIIIFAFIQQQREIDYRESYIKQQAEIINRRIIALCEEGNDFHSFLIFIGSFLSQTVMEGTSVAVYDNRADIKIAEVGHIDPRVEFGNNEIKRYQGADINTLIPDSDPYDPDKALFVRQDISPDGRYKVVSIIPETERLSSAVNSTWWCWVFIIICGIVMTVVTYLSTLHLTRNVQLLRRLAEAASEDKDFPVNAKYPNNDLGEISRRITEIYVSRQAARVSKEVEHKVALKATEEQYNMRRQLTDNISHELKTPVGIIRGYLDTILENPDMEADMRNHFLDKTQSQVLRLCNLLEDLSTMTRLDQGATRIPMEAINFGDLVAALSTDIAESGIARSMVFTYNIPDDCIIKGNSSLLTAALMNLVKNAVNYSKGTEMGIDFLARNQRFYTFVFYDNGTGVGQEHIPHLFERFYRVDKGRSRKVGGTGLGLPIVRSTFNTMGGSITVRNRETGGLEFVFTLPLWRDKEKKAPEAKATQKN